jgi:hypothetical protein
VSAEDPMLGQSIKNFDLSLEMIFSIIEDIQDLAKFTGNQMFTLTNDYLYSFLI